MLRNVLAKTRVPPNSHISPAYHTFQSLNATSRGYPAVSRYLSTSVPRRNKAGTPQTPDDSVTDKWAQELAALKSQLEEGKLDPGLVERIQNDGKPQKWQPTPEQIAEAEALQDKPLPVKRDEMINYLVNLIMRGGKKDVARRHLNEALYLIYLKTRQDPVKLLKDSIEKARPLVEVVVQATGTAKSRHVPKALNTRASIRRAWVWILEASAKRKSNSFSVRLAEEILAAYAGNSSIYEKRSRLHKDAIPHISEIRIKR